MREEESFTHVSVVKIWNVEVLLSDEGSLPSVIISLIMGYLAEKDGREIKNVNYPTALGDLEWLCRKYSLVTFDLDHINGAKSSLKYPDLVVRHIEALISYIRGYQDFHSLLNYHSTHGSKSKTLESGFYLSVLTGNHLLIDKLVNAYGPDRTLSASKALYKSYETFRFLSGRPFFDANYFIKNLLLDVSFYSYFANSYSLLKLAAEIVVKTLQISEYETEQVFFCAAQFLKSALSCREHEEAEKFGFSLYSLFSEIKGFEDEKFINYLHTQAIENKEFRSVVLSNNRKLQSKIFAKNVFEIYSKEYQKVRYACKDLLQLQYLYKIITIQQLSTLFNVNLNFSFLMTIMDYCQEGLPEILSLWLHDQVTKFLMLLKDVLIEYDYELSPLGGEWIDQKGHKSSLLSADKYKKVSSRARQAMEDLNSILNTKAKSYLNFEHIYSFSTFFKESSEGAKKSKTKTTADFYNGLYTMIAAKGNEIFMDYQKLSKS